MDEYEIKQMNDYAMTKWVNEMQIKNSATQFNTESVIIRISNTHGPGEYYSPYRSVNCRFVYCALNNLPWIVFKGYSRSSIYIEDAVTTIANIVDNFMPGEIYNISGTKRHSIEELSNIIMEESGADPNLVKYRDEEILTTRDKIVDVSKAVIDLKHNDQTPLRDGVIKTINWMREELQINR